MSLTSDIIRGHTEAIILAQLLDHDSYGYEITKAMFDNQADLANAQAKFGFLSPEGAVAGSFDLHPGAEKYYKEIGVL